MKKKAELQKEKRSNSNLTMIDLQILRTLNPKLQMIIKEASRHINICLLEGYRKKEDKNHNIYLQETRFDKQDFFPSKVCQIVPYFSEYPHIRWKDKESFHKLEKLIKQIANNVGCCVISWKSKKRIKDVSYFELVD